jgi:hypothetical protein
MTKSTVALWVLFAASIGLNLWQGSLLRAMRLKNPSVSLASDIEKIIADREDILVLGVNGEHERIRLYSPGLTVLYWLSPTCSWCKVNENNFRAIAGQAKGRYQFWALSSAESHAIEQYRRRESIPTQVWRLTASSGQRLGLNGTPSTLIVKDGIVLARIQGIYAVQHVEALEDILSIQLPGVLQGVQKAFEK